MQAIKTLALVGALTLGATGCEAFEADRQAAVIEAREADNWLDQAIALVESIPEAERTPEAIAKLAQWKAQEQSWTERLAELERLSPPQLQARANEAAGNAALGNWLGALGTVIGAGAAAFGMRAKRQVSEQAHEEAREAVEEARRYADERVQRESMARDASRMANGIRPASTGFGIDLPPESAN